MYTGLGVACGILRASPSTIPTLNDRYDFPEPVTEQIPFGFAQIAATPSQGPIYGGNFVQGDGYTNSSHDFSTQLPPYPSGQNAPVPLLNDGRNVPCAAGSQMGNFFAGVPTPTPGFQQLGSQWTGTHKIVQTPPYTSNHGVDGDLFSFGVGMDDMTINVPFFPNAGAVGDNLDRAYMEDPDSIMMDTPMIPNSIDPFQQAVASIAQAPSAPPGPLATVQGPAPRVSCSYCPQTFKRAADRVRHENSKHLRAPGAHMCPIAGCRKNQDQGFSRADKVTTHMWQEHGHLGYLKRV